MASHEVEAPSLAELAEQPAEQSAEQAEATAEQAEQAEQAKTEPGSRVARGDSFVNAGSIAKDEEVLDRPGQVLVAIRARPFLSSELSEQSPRVVDMEGHKTHVATLTPGGAPDVKEYVQYRCHDSVDDKMTNCATQQDVFDGIGHQAVLAALAGYNVCVFAYGQVGAGKTHTMVGTETEPGLIPRIARALFDHCAATQTEFSCEFSSYELYNEHVQDLLSTDKAQQARLRVREHPKKGPFVEGLSHHAITDIAHLEQLLWQGHARRTVGDSPIHPTSHRGHAIFDIAFRQFTNSNGLLTERSSRVQLVDMAGIERLSTAAGSHSETRIKDSGTTNKSLTVFGQCLKALANKAKVAAASAGMDTTDSPSASRRGSLRRSSSNAGRIADVHIPYRDSSLTWLLKESLGGNSRTFMVAAISPAECNRKETLSTLLYADRAKKIVNAAVVNEDRNTAAMKELEDEIVRLKKELKKQSSSGAAKAAAAVAVTPPPQPSVPHETRGTQTDPEPEPEKGPDHEARALELGQQLEAAMAARDQLQQQLSDAQDASTKTTTVLEQRASDAEQALQEAQDRLSAQETALTAANTTRQELDEALLAARAEVEKLAGEVEALQQAQQSAAGDEADTQARLAFLEREVANLQEAQQKVAQAEEEARTHAEQLQEELAQANGRAQAAEEKVLGLETALSEAQAQAASLGDQDAQRKDELAQMRRQLTEQQSELNQVTGQLQELQVAAQSTAADEQAAHGDDLAAWQQRCQRLEEQLYEAHALVDELKQRLRKQREFFRKKFLSQWEPNTTQCTNCQLPFNKFSIRPHHCRICGEVFCTNCCADRVKTTAARKPVRACQECMQFMNKLMQNDPMLDEM